MVCPEAKGRHPRVRSSQEYFEISECINSCASSKCNVSASDVDNPFGAMETDGCVPPATANTSLNSQGKMQQKTTMCISIIRRSNGLFCPLAPYTIPLAAVISSHEISKHSEVETIVEIMSTPWNYM